jgi:hypothetical protein
MTDSNFEDFDAAPPPEESNNRTFIIVAGILGGIILISAACVAGLVLFNGLPGSGVDPNAAANQTATAQAASAFINQALTATFEAGILPTATNSPTPSATPVVAVASGKGNLPCMSLTKYFRKGMRKRIPRNPPSADAKKTW